MSENKSMDLQQVQADIMAKDPSQKKVRSLSNAKNLTARNSLESIKPAGSRVLITLKSWPSQSAGGIFVPDSYAVIRGEKYIGEVHEVGEDVKLVAKGDVIIFSMFSGYHVTTTTGHAKLLDESNILLYKTKAEMEATKSFDPITFKPGINHILIEVFKRGEQTTASGLLIEQGEDTAISNNDAVTKSGRIISIGETNDYGKQYNGAGVGAVIVFDSYVGIDVNSNDITDADKYKLMLGQHVLAVISD
jgi:co-chaperonin GroES (HSP10)